MSALADYPTVDAGIASSLHRICAEYREMPGLSLTRRQMERLFGFESDLCEALIEALVDARILRKTASGCYIAD